MCFFNLAKPFSAIQRFFFRVFGLLAEHNFRMFEAFFFYFACACFFLGKPPPDCILCVAGVCFFCGSVVCRVLCVAGVRV